MAAGIRLTHEEATLRFEAAGLQLLSQYERQSRKVVARCALHDFACEVYPSNIFKGQGLQCCKRETLSKLHTGKKLSASTKQKLSELNSGERHRDYGRPMSADRRRRVSEGMRRAAGHSVDYAILKASTGKTAGHPGFFYIARLGDGLLKLGSLVRYSPSARMQNLRHATGSAELLFLAQVPDAGAYEAMMLDRCREHWSHGEYFHDWLKSPAPMS